MDIAISAIFQPGLRRCSITIGSESGTFTYNDLPVRHFYVREGEPLCQVFIPCALDIGRNLMAAFGMDAVFGYLHPERDVVAQPKAMPVKRSSAQKKAERGGQLRLWGD